MPSHALQQAFELQYQASRRQVAVPAMLRKERLLRVQRMLDEHGAVLTAAVQADFGVRSVRLTEFADLLVLRTQLKQALRQLERWMRPRHVSTPLSLFPARARIERQPLGVVGIIAPGTTRCSSRWGQRLLPWRPATASCSSPVSWRRTRPLNWPLWWRSSLPRMSFAWSRGTTICPASSLACLLIT